VFDIPEKSIFAMLDPDRLSRIFQNLADNAVRYNPKGTTVSVSLSAEDEKAIILFQDDGCGIPNHLAEDIFKPFVRTDDSRSSEAGSSGLGLSIAKKIAVAHDGNLTLRTNMNHGCTFVITLPLI
jgi:signal transduction histidine kinase